MAGETIAPDAAAAPPAPTAGTEAEGGGHKVFPPFDPTFFPSQLLWLAITFAVLYFLMAKVALPRIGGILADRRNRIAADLDKAEALKAQSEAAIAAYEKALAEARANAFKIAEGAREASKKAADAERATTEAGLARQIAAAETRIGEIKTRALSDVGAIAAEAAEAVVKALSDASVARPEIEAAVAASMPK